MSKIKCKCGKVYSVRPEMRGRKVKCKDCDQTFVVGGKKLEKIPDQNRRPAASPPPLKEREVTNSPVILEKYEDAVGSKSAISKNTFIIGLLGIALLFSLAAFAGYFLLKSGPSPASKLSDKLIGVWENYSGSMKDGKIDLAVIDRRKYYNDGTCVIHITVISANGTPITMNGVTTTDGLGEIAKESSWVIEGNYLLTGAVGGPKTEISFVSNDEFIFTKEDGKKQTWKRIDALPEGWWEALE